MDMESFSLARSLLFVAGSLVFLRISWKPLHNPKCHGFYRFFAFEGILFLVLLNHPYWFETWYAPRQIVSWLLLAASILFVVQALHMLRTAGGSEARAGAPENFAFENTVHLVTGGIYRYIRHPMYSSLMLLAWGAFFKHFSLVGLVGVAITTGLLIVAGGIEEKENLAFFGPAYLEYRKTTKMFLPFLI
ncbi:MAG: protein-S-isoprenylcysteine methyltransferase [Desulfuromonadaceae bacterium GWC2_58_13]|nr:MAG: protein-S-isoprenylcysteine methyltransferase [Desulfuromonadaceae bacterium GWC2_58_13]